MTTSTETGAPAAVPHQGIPDGINKPTAFPAGFPLHEFRARASAYRTSQRWELPAGGFVIFFENKLCGWSLVPRADHYRPGVIAIGERVAMYACGPAGGDTARSWESVVLDQ